MDLSISFRTTQEDPILFEVRNSREYDFFRLKVSMEYGIVLLVQLASLKSAQNEKCQIVMKRKSTIFNI